MMRENERLLRQARKCFAEAATAADRMQMQALAEKGAEYLAQAQQAAAQEKKKNENENGSGR